MHLERLELLDAPHHFDLVAVGLLQAHALAAAGLVDIFDSGSAGRLGDLLQVVLAGRVEGEPDKPRVALLGHVDMMRRIRAAHIERVLGPLHLDEPEVGAELLLDIQVGRAQPPVSDIGHFDQRHCDALRTWFSFNFRTFSGQMLSQKRDHLGPQLERRLFAITVRPLVGEEGVAGVAVDIQSNPALERPAKSRSRLRARPAPGRLLLRFTHRPYPLERKFVTQIVSIP